MTVPVLSELKSEWFEFSYSDDGRESSDVSSVVPGSSKSVRPRFDWLPVVLMSLFVPLMMTCGFFVLSV